MFLIPRLILITSLVLSVQYFQGQQSSPPGWVWPNALLDADFAHQRYWFNGANAAFEALFTTTRATTHTCTTAGGAIFTAAINAPCVTDNGLMSWQGTTNLLAQSQFGGVDGSPWLKSSNNATLTPNAVNSPDGTADAATLIEDSASATHLTRQTVNKGASSAAYTFSVYGLNTATRRIALQIDDNASNGAVMVCDLAGQQVGAGPTLLGTGFSTATATAQAMGSWTRCGISVTSNTAIVMRTLLMLDDGTGTGARNTSYQGNGTSGVTLFGAQLEQFSGTQSPGPYIVTTTASASASADQYRILVTLPIVDVSTFISWNDQMGGNATTRRAIDRIGSGYWVVNPMTGGATTVGVTGGASCSFTNTPLFNSTHTMAASISVVSSASAVRCSYDQSVITAASGTKMAADTGFQLGSTNIATASLNGYIRRWILAPGLRGDGELMRFSANN